MQETQQDPLFGRVAFIGIGLIGSSMAWAIRRAGLARTLTCYTPDDSMQRALALGVVDEVYSDAVAAVQDADLVVLAVPVKAMASAAAAIGPGLKAGAIVTDVGSVKQAVIADVLPFLPADVFLVPGHPIAGTEHSGPEAGFASLFEDRWCILTPLPARQQAKEALRETGGKDVSRQAVDRVRALWEGFGAKVEEMEPAHHDRVLAITSHLPHLIAYTIVGTADTMENEIKREVLKYTASGFRDFTRIAASDPTMWRDIFLSNREAVLEVLQCFSEDLAALQRAIRRGEGQVLFDWFAHVQPIRRALNPPNTGAPGVK